jgi:hypothetical protein
MPKARARIALASLLLALAATVAPATVAPATVAPAAIAAADELPPTPAVIADLGWGSTPADTPIALQGDLGWG